LAPFSESGGTIVLNGDCFVIYGRYKLACSLQPALI